MFKVNTHHSHPKKKGPTPFKQLGLILVLLVSLSLAGCFEIPQATDETTEEETNLTEASGTTDSTTPTTTTDEQLGTLLLEQMDQDQDGQLSRGEWTYELESFEQLDTDGDGFINENEFSAIVIATLEEFQEDMVLLVQNLQAELAEIKAAMSELQSEVSGQGVALPERTPRLLNYSIQSGQLQESVTYRNGASSVASTYDSADLPNECAALQLELTTDSEAEQPSSDIVGTWKEASAVMLLATSLGDDQDSFLIEEANYYLSISADGNTASYVFSGNSCEGKVGQELTGNSVEVYEELEEWLKHDHDYDDFKDYIPAEIEISVVDTGLSAIVKAKSGDLMATALLSAVELPTACAAAPTKPGTPELDSDPEAGLIGTWYLTSVMFEVNEDNSTDTERQGHGKKKGPAGRHETRDELMWFIENFDFSEIELFATIAADGGAMIYVQPEEECQALVWKELNGNVVELDGDYLSQRPKPEKIEYVSSETGLIGTVIDDFGNSMRQRVFAATELPSSCTVTAPITGELIYDTNPDASILGVYLLEEVVEIEEEDAEEKTAVETNTAETNTDEEESTNTETSTEEALETDTDIEVVEPSEDAEATARGGHGGFSDYFDFEAPEIYIQINEDGSMITYEEMNDECEPVKWKELDGNTQLLDGDYVPQFAVPERAEFSANESGIQGAIYDQTDALMQQRQYVAASLPNVCMEEEVEKDQAVDATEPSSEIVGTWKLTEVTEVQSTEEQTVAEERLRQAEAGMSAVCDELLGDELLGSEVDEWFQRRFPDQRPRPLQNHSGSSHSDQFENGLEDSDYDNLFFNEGNFEQYQVLNEQDNQGRGFLFNNTLDRPFNRLETEDDWDGLPAVDDADEWVDWFFDAAGEASADLRGPSAQQGHRPNGQRPGDIRDDRDDENHSNDEHLVTQCERLLQNGMDEFVKKSKSERVHYLVIESDGRVTSYQADEDNQFCGGRYAGETSGDVLQLDWKTMD